MIAMRRPGAGMMHDYDGMMDGSGSWFAMLVGLLLLLALTGIAIYWIVRATSPTAAPAPARAPSTSSPRAVLDLRLARGEITPEEYGATAQLLDRSV